MAPFCCIPFLILLLFWFDFPTKSKHEQQNVVPVYFLLINMYSLEVISKSVNRRRIENTMAKRKQQEYAKHFTEKQIGNPTKTRDGLM